MKNLTKKILKKENYEDKKIALEYVKMDGMNLRFFPKFQDDHEVCKLALLNNKDSFMYVKLDLLFSNEEFWLFVFNLYLKNHLN